MTIEEFDKTGWTGNMKCVHKKKEYEIISVDFEERIIAINEFDSFGDNGADDLDWKRCENIELLQPE